MRLATALLKKRKKAVMLTTYYEELQKAASVVGKDVITICRKAGLPESTRKDLPFVASPHAKTKMKIFRALKSYGWDERCG